MERKAFAAVVGLFFLVACGDSSPPTEVPDPSNTVASVEVAPTVDTLASLGASRQMQATARNAAGGVVTGKTTTWTSTASSIVAVDAGGVATAVANGTARVTATIDGVSGEATVVVRQVVTSLVASVGRDTIRAIGDTAQATATPRDARSNAVTGRSVIWSSSDTSTAAVNATGVVTARKNGSVTVTAEVDGVQGSVGVVVRQTGAALAVTQQPAGASAGQAFGTQPVLEIRDAKGNVVAGDDTTLVTAAIASGGGSLVGTSTSTAVDGIVSFSDLGIGGTVGSRTLVFAASGIPSAISSAFNLGPGPPSQLAITGGNNQTTLAGTVAPEPLEVTVDDDFANGVSGVGVTWTLTAGSGSLSATGSTTGTGGTASVQLTLDPSAGNNTVEALSGGLSGSPAAFTVTGTPNGRINGTVTITSSLLAPPPTVASAGTVQPDVTNVAVSAKRPKSRAFAFEDATARHPPSPVLRSDRAPEYVADELIITFDAGVLRAPAVGAAAYRQPSMTRSVSLAMRAAVAADLESTGLRALGESPAILAMRVKAPPGADLEGIANGIRWGNPAVRSVERNAIVRHMGIRDNRALVPTTLPNDPFYPLQAWHYRMIDLPRAWTTTTGSASVVVAVVDDGIRFDHPAIAPNLTADGYDFVSNATSVPICSGGSIGNAGDGDGPDSDPTNPVDVVIDPTFNCISAVKSSGNHGLHVAGTVGAVGNDGSGGSGVAWTVSLRPVRVLGLAGGTNYDIAQGILYAAGLPADDGAGGSVQAATPADIINLSLGGPTNATVLANAVTAASNAGSLLIAAAGNDAVSTPSYPAAYPEVVSVSAVGPDAVLASYSNFGSTIDIAAPGGDLGDGGCTFAITSTTWDYVNGLPIHDCWQGTSMAAPHLSGVAALLLAAEPGLPASQLRSRLLSFAVDLGAAGPDQQYGAGLVNAFNSLTQSFGPPRSLLVALVNGASGVIVERVASAADGSYSFTELPDAQYWVFAGQDESGDQVTGVALRRWGAFGGTATPSTVAVAGAGDYPATFSIGVPFENEPNGATTSADRLLVGGYLFGLISDPSTDVDVVEILIPTAGQYVIQTVSPFGACGFALSEDTIVDLFDAALNLVASNDDIDAGNLDFCSRISTALAAGTYYVAVTGYSGGQYALEARALP